ncbi:hypothetical protein [Paenibacillus pasadenensis]|uniref:hypothetical protein n=1 Tax=Paenibacillus pasadenensis TaxID=217090 RepID=UPI00333F1A7A
MAMNVHVTNHVLSVGCVEILGVAASSLFQIGDTDSMVMYSIFDTPPEAIIVGPFAPLPEPDNNTEAGVIQNPGGQTIVPVIEESESLQSSSGALTPSNNVNRAIPSSRGGAR